MGVAANAECNVIIYSILLLSNRRDLDIKDIMLPNVGNQLLH